MEALSVYRNRQAETVLTLMSDDNFSPIQRTLLLQFVLKAAELGRVPTHAFYSDRRASTGSRRDALIAGQVPESNPITINVKNEIKKDASIHNQMNVPLSADVLKQRTEERDNADPVRNQDRKNIPQQSPGNRQRQRLTQELQTDVPPARAQRLQYSDLVRPLLHAEQHNVHDAYACNRQGEQPDHLQQSLDRQTPAR